jgi:hypothetical protein
MTLDELVKYVDDAIARIGGASSSSAHGSHNAGIFNKAAGGLERKIAEYAVGVTKKPDLAKRTLGQLIPVLAALPVSCSEPLKTVVDEAAAANAIWIKVKHGDEPPDPELLRGLRSTKRALSALQGSA